MGELSKKDWGMLGYRRSQGTTSDEHDYNRERDDRLIEMEEIKKIGLDKYIKQKEELERKIKEWEALCPCNPQKCPLDNHWVCIKSCKLHIEWLEYSPTCGTKNS